MFAKKTVIFSAMKTKLLLLFAFLFISNTPWAGAQCSEAENASMKKYADLTRNSADVQGCSMCAWLANLYCIAENGLYENDRAGVEKAINDTKSNIKFMGTDCCPELLTKSVKWGAPPAKHGAETQAAPPHALQQEMDQLKDGLDYLNAVAQIDSSYEQLQADLKKVEQAVQENALMGKGDFNSEEELEADYATRLNNLNKLEATHLKLKAMNAELGHSAARETRNYDVGLGAITTIGAIAESATYKKESKAFMDAAKSKLKNDRSNKLFEFQNRDKSFEAVLDQESLNHYIEGENYSGSLENLHQYSIVPGYTAGMKYNDYKKLIPNYNSKYVSPNQWSITGDGIKPQTFIRMGKKKMVGEVQQITVLSEPFSVAAMAGFQEQMWEEIKQYNKLFGFRPVYYKYLSGNESNNQIVNVADSGALVIWVDKGNKCFVLTLKIHRNENELMLLNSKLERNLQTPVAGSAVDVFLAEINSPAN